jgi:hypothetical protein
MRGFRRGTTEERVPLAPRATTDDADARDDGRTRVDDDDAFDQHPSSSGRASSSRHGRPTTMAFAAMALLASSAAIAHIHTRGSSAHQTKLRLIAETMGSPERAHPWVLDDYEPKDDGDFTALRIRPPMRLTSPMSEDFKRIHALGSAEDEGMANVVFSQEAVEVGRAIDAQSRGETRRVFETSTMNDPFWDVPNATVGDDASVERPQQAAKIGSKRKRAATLGRTTVRKPRRALPQKRAATNRAQTRKMEDKDTCAKLQRALQADSDFIADFGEEYFANTFEDYGTGVIFGGDAKRKGIKLLAKAYLFPKLDASAYARLVDENFDEEDDEEDEEFNGGHATEAKLGASSSSPEEECKILYFYHVPRTGGGSLVGYLANSRLDVQRFERSKFAKNGTELFALQQLTDEEHWSRIVTNVLRPGSHVIHHHVGRAGLLDMGERLASLRRQAETRGCGFKSFTILREPLHRDLSEAAARPARTSAKRDYLDEQTRFLLVNAGNQVSKSWPKFLTSENTDLPGLFESTTELLERTFDDIYVLSDEETVVKEVNAFFGIVDNPLATLRSSIRHVSSYSGADDARRATFARIRRAHADAEEADWLDQKLFAWALQRASGGLPTHHGSSVSSSKLLDADVLDGVE